jgi:protocatechuate 3,4-dioxygenase beta subunit
MNSGRREFLQQASIGLAAVGAAGLVLRADAQPTLALTAEEVGRVLIQMGAMPKEQMTAAGEVKKITPMPYGPFYKPGSPFRGKISTMGEPGTPFVLTGRVWAFDTRRPIAGAVLEMWHVDTQEKYSDGVKDFRNRGRLISSETGAYEVESIRPIPYRPNAAGAPDFWRCAHLHLLVVSPGYKPLVTEIHFQGDPKNGQSFEAGVFDIVLERDPDSK